MSSCHYRTLGLAEGAPVGEVKKAFKALALRCHPDRLVGAPEAERLAGAARFKAITEAYEVLADDSKRTAYLASRRASTYSSTGASTSGYAYGYGSGPTAGTRYTYGRSARPNYWAAFTQRLASTRPIEFAFFAALAGMAGTAIWAVDDLWAWRNQGKHFNDMLARTSTEGRAASVAPVLNSAVSPPLGCGIRSRQYKPSAPMAGNPAEMSLAELVQLEDAARGATPRPAGGAAAAPGRPELGKGAGAPVDRAHIVASGPRSPGQMMGHG